MITNTALKSTHFPILHTVAATIGNGSGDDDAAMLMFMLARKVELRPNDA